MSNSTLTPKQKKQLTAERQKAVRQAWKEERQRVLEGKGTRQWTNLEKKELIRRGSVSGYDGHHMKSVSTYPKFAGDSKNIQFLTEKEHLYGAHRGSYHNKTNGYYDPKTKEMNGFRGNQHPKAPLYDLNTKLSKTIKQSSKSNDNANQKIDSFKSSIKSNTESSSKTSASTTHGKSKGTGIKR
ncbi:hypothetical protein [Ruminococcus sp. zg-924]|uniref:hypothetical protein n=1 Tax=Ruminococcus sp. zg-924 TaxID=2678505 RepID=UPI00210AC271|nr:hypothetical protein [Ruminococcus sp. zg-924]